MQRTLSARWIQNSLRTTEPSSSSQIPLFLCPALTRPPSLRLRRPFHNSASIASEKRMLLRDKLRDLPYSTEFDSIKLRPSHTADDPLFDEAQIKSPPTKSSQPRRPPIRDPFVKLPLPSPPRSPPLGDPPSKKESVAANNNNDNNNNSINPPVDTDIGPTNPKDGPKNLAEKYNIHTLPALCHGCGAFTQTEDPKSPGYYDVSRKVVKHYLGQIGKEERGSTSQKQTTEALKVVDTEALSKMGIDISDILQLPPTTKEEPEPSSEPRKPPLCDRCHDLIYHNVGAPIYHPDVESLVETILESPFKRNHIYHIIDAADFPMSAIPRMRMIEDLMPLRGRNRRSQRDRWTHGKQMDVSFIITRADLLAPTQVQVQRLLPYLREVLRDALGRNAKNIRLGNIRPVSAKDSWWTKEIKEEIWHRGGANWVVGKGNVGKSMFFETIFPKGDREDPTKGKVEVKVFPKMGPTNATGSTTPETPEHKDRESISLEEALREEGIDIQEPVNELSLLPPAFPEQMYPPMPTVSALPGTTAQPIRRPFGKSRGELIDLPGLPRSELDQFVSPAFQDQLVLHKRIKPNETTTVKPGQSLLLGGILRITPKEDGPLMLMVNFTPFEEHVTSNIKVEAIQTGAVENPMVEYIGNAVAKESIKYAGTFELNTDITKERAGPLTRKDAVGLKVERLPFLVLGTDILIEGVGWVEVTAQVRRREFENNPDVQQGGGADIVGTDDPFEAELLGGMSKTTTTTTARTKFPTVDVYTPQGRFVAARRCIDGFVHNRPRDWGKKPPRRTRSYKGGEEKKRRKEEKRKDKRMEREREGRDGSGGGRMV